MNIFKTLNDMVWRNNASQELVAIPSGEFYVIGLNMQRTCRYIDARATIKRTSMPFQYRLCVERIYEEGEDTLEVQGDDDDEHSVLIDKVIQFKVRMVSGSTAFSWKGMSKDSQGLTFEFVCAEETTAFTANNFEITVYQCMYERQYNQSHVDAEEDAIAEFQIKSLFNIPVSKTTCRSPTSPRKEAAPVVSHNMPTPSLRASPAAYNGVIDVPADLCLWDDSTALFFDHALNARCQLVRERRDTYWLLIVDGNGNQQLAQKLEPRMSPVFSPEKLTFIWNYFDDNQKIYSWLLRFKDDNVLRSFQRSYANCMADVLNNQPASASTSIRTSSSTVRTQRSGYGFEQSDDDDEEDGLENDEEEDGEEGDRGDDHEDDGDESDGSIISSFDQNDGAKNSELAVGYKDRSFVVRGSKVGVFGYGKSDGLRFHTTIKNLKNKVGNEVKPSQVMLHEEDTSMVMLDPRNKHQAYKMDLEYGKIVEEWDLHGTSGVHTLIGDGKYAHTTQTKTMLGLAEDAIFRIDSRQPGGMIVEREKKQYAKGNKFLCGATSGNGSLAMASSKDIKLFNRIGGIATVSIPTLGSPVIGIDVAGNGRWVLATCKEYIMLFDVLNPKSNALGFDRKFPADDKPAPIKLQLLPGHVAAMKAPVSFIPARFNTGINEEEMYIVTSTGPYVITWNFRRVKLGHREYSMREYPQKVVADNFRFGQSRSIIVALPDDVAAVSTGKMEQVNK